MKYIYSFVKGNVEGSAEQKNTLGGKGANLAEMTNLKLPVPPGFIISTDACIYYYENDRQLPQQLGKQLQDALLAVEKDMGKSFGSTTDPLLMSIRSGARLSMPGMMETVLNVGLTTKTIPGLIEKTTNPRFVYDAYRRLIMMYADVVMEKAVGKEPQAGLGIRQRLEKILGEYKAEKQYTLDTDLTAVDWAKLAKSFKAEIKTGLGEEFPDDPMAQLWGGIKAVFQSWNGTRAVNYRRIENIPDKWGTAVNVQSMVFGNMGDDCATGVAFTRNPATGENKFYGEWLPNAQGEDVVAGIRTPNPLNEDMKTTARKEMKSLERSMPKLYKQLMVIRSTLENHYTDMQDIEFTIQEGRLWMLQTRSGKRNGAAAIKMAVDMVKEGLIDKETALQRIKPKQLDELLHPMLDTAAEKKATLLATGLPAGPGGASGKIVFTADDAATWHKQGEQVILVREETSPEDIHGMHASEGILTAKGGMTSHAALVARGWGKCCIVGCSELHINAAKRELHIGDIVLREGDLITLNGAVGNVYSGQVNLIPADPDTHSEYKILMQWADEIRTLKVRANADTPADAGQAIAFGAQGIGLCRTEHMFFEEKQILTVRKMILADNETDKRAAVMELLPYQKTDFRGILKVMAGKPVTIRLLDPPLHEFMTLTKGQVRNLAAEVNKTIDDVKKRIAELHELNPMLGHRGCRLGIAYPEITEMQTRAIIEAAVELTEAGVDVFPEIMIPLVGTATEFTNQEAIVRQVAEDVITASGVEISYLVGTMIELPRACLTADEIAEHAEFFSFGTNDLTQTTYGFSRDDIGWFLPDYLERNILSHDPFQSLDVPGVGKLIAMAVKSGRGVNEKLKIGICGEHGGDPTSIHFCKKNNLDYVSCSPFRVPIARLAAAQAEWDKDR